MEIWINKRGEYIHEVCEEVLYYRGTSTVGEVAEARFDCWRCDLDSISIPLVAIPRLRMEVRAGDIGDHRPDPAFLLNLRPVGNRVPPQRSPTKLPVAVEVKHEVDTRKCKLCNLPHVVPPQASTR